MHALIWDGRHLNAVDDLDVREPGDGEIIVEIDAAGLCHSDLKPIDGDIPQQLPVVLGHEAAGRVVATGPGTTIGVGQRVVLSVLRACGTCAACTAGKTTMCRTPVPDSATPFSRHGEPVAQFVRLGAFARQTVIAENQAIAVDADISAACAALLGCAAITAFGAVRERARVQPGESVAVIGAGGIGLNAIQAARISKAGRITVFDTNPRKEELARRLGATEFVLTAGADDAVAHSRQLQRGGFDVVLECVGRADLLEASISMLAWGGRAVIVGLPPTGTRIDFPVRALFNDKSLLGCRMGSVDPHEYIPYLAGLYAAGELELDSLITKVVPLSRAGELVQDLRDGVLDRGVFDLTDGGAGR